MKKEEEQISFRDIDAKQIIDCISDEEAGQIIDDDEKLVYGEMVWDQQNARLKKENVILDEDEKQLIILINKGTKIADIAEIKHIEQVKLEETYQNLCKKLCVKNKKEALRRIKELKLF